MDAGRIIADHVKFWNREKPSRPLAAVHIGDFFFATHYRAARHLLVQGKPITPDMLDVDSFLEDYERLYNETLPLGCSTFWAAEPYTGIPWMEAFWGCGVIAGENSFVSHPVIHTVKNLENLAFAMDNPWVEKYFEFVKKLKSLSRGRFPVGQPIMRGPGDVAGALLGQSEFIFALYEEPQIIRGLLDRIADSFIAVNEQMHRIAGDFHGGTSIGFYHVWAPGKCVWFQDDIRSLLSPQLYRDFLLKNEKRVCGLYDYTLTHLHPSAFFTLDAMLENERLRVVEINKDAGGPDVREMLPEFRKVLDRKRNLVIWGDLTVEDLKIVCGSLPPEGIFFFLAEPDLKTAEEAAAYLCGLRF
ncbi:MAG: hypothetical protein FWG35_06695 [Spirochaetaceae bacterium]|nr:hypothetical protein [Spirochaetaceae bacterium]